jgi:hypothetical protein
MTHTAIQKQLRYARRYERALLRGEGSFHKQHKLERRLREHYGQIREWLPIKIAMPCVGAVFRICGAPRPGELMILVGPHAKWLNWRPDKNGHLLKHPAYFCWIKDGALLNHSGRKPGAKIGRVDEEYALFMAEWVRLQLTQ